MSVFRRLYRGETNIQFIKTRKRWYLASLILVVICIGSMIFRGFNFGIDFAGGTKFQLPTSANGQAITTGDVDKAFSEAGISNADPAQQVGTGGAATITIQTGSLNVGGQQDVQKQVADDLGLQPDQISIDSVSSDWGHDVTVKAIEGLLVFLVVVSIYISIRFQWRMAVGGMVALLHDLILAAGIYSLVGFEVTPSTVVGLLTILGFSLYDTVVVYDKVAENSKDLLAGSRMTFSDAANLAVNQTLMRSINTSLIALLPVAGLLFVGAGLLGVGTIKDLALILFVGLASGAYSSLFLATPIVVDLTEHTAEYRALTKRVVAKRSAEARREAENAELIAAGLPPRAATRRTGAPAPAPRPGARPARSRRKR
jgi:preprotein translocase subunit SecF